MTSEAQIRLDVAIREIVQSDLAGFHDWYGPDRDESFRRSLDRHRSGEIVYLVRDSDG